MKKIMTFVAIATLAAFCLACSKEIGNPVTNQPQEKTAIEGSTVYLNIGLSEDTKISHDLDGTTIKPRWESTDALKVTFTVSATPVEETFNIDASSISADGRSARFYKDDSQLASRDGNFDVAYAGNATDWSVQDGTYANLPEVLAKTGLSSTDSPIALESQLTYFHFDLSTAATPTEALELANAYFYNNTHALIIDSSNNTGDINITRTMTYTTDGDGADADFYVAAKLAADSNGDTFGIDLQNGDHYAGVQGYSLTWNAAKSYSTGAVYKITSVGSGEGKLLAYVSGMVGAEGNTTGWYGAHSENIEIPVGKRLNIQYVNYNKGTGDGWLNADLVISNTKDIYTDDNSYRYFYLRNDGWGTGNNNYLFKDRNGYPDNYFVSLMSDLNGAVVNVTIDHGTAGYVSIASEATTAGNDKLHQYYSHAVSASDPIYAFYTVDQCHLVVKSAVLSDLPDNENVTGLSTMETTVYYNGATDKMNLSPFGIKATANTSGSGYAISDMYGASGSGLVSVAATTSTLYYSGVTAASATTVNVSENTVIPSNTVLGGTDAGWSDNDGYMFTVAPGTSQVVGATLTSRKTNNWDCPTVSMRNKDNGWLANFRMDNWGRGAPYKDDDSDEKVKVRRSSNWDWENFKTNMDDSSLYITVSNNGNGKASVRYNLQKGVNSFFEYFDNIPIPVGENIKFCISTEYCALTIM